MRKNHSKITDSRQRFSIRKLSVGAASVLLGTTFLFSKPDSVQAAENKTPNNENDDTNITDESTDTKISTETRSINVETKSNDAVNSQEEQDNSVTGQSATVASTNSTTESDNNSVSLIKEDKSSSSIDGNNSQADDTATSVQTNTFVPKSSQSNETNDESKTSVNKEQLKSIATSLKASYVAGEDNDQQEVDISLRPYDVSTKQFIDRNSGIVSRINSTGIIGATPYFDQDKVDQLKKDLQDLGYVPLDMNIPGVADIIHSYWFVDENGVHALHANNQDSSEYKKWEEDAVKYTEDKTGLTGNQIYNGDAKIGEHATTFVYPVVSRLDFQYPTELYLSVTPTLTVDGESDDNWNQAHKNDLHLSDYTDEDGNNITDKLSGNISYDTLNKKFISTPGDEFSSRDLKYTLLDGIVKRRNDKTSDNPAGTGYYYEKVIGDYDISYEEDNDNHTIIYTIDLTPEAKSKILNQLDKNANGDKYEFDNTKQTITLDSKNLARQGEIWRTSSPEEYLKFCQNAYTVNGKPYSYSAFKINNIDNDNDNLVNNSQNLSENIQSQDYVGEGGPDARGDYAGEENSSPVYITLNFSAHKIPKAEKESGTTTSTVHYVVSDGKVAAPEDNIQTIDWNRTKTTDYAGNITYTDWQTATSKYKDVATPYLTGYKADIQNVVGENTKYGENPYTVVTYTPITPEKEPGITTSTVHYIVSDGKVTAPKDSVQTVNWIRDIIPDTSGKLIYGNWSTDTNKYSDVATPYLPGYIANIQNVVGEDTKYGENPYTVVIYTPLSSAKETGTTTSTVHYIVSDGKVAAPKDNVQTVDWARTITPDKNGNLIYGTWNTNISKYADVATPYLPGYTANTLTVDGKNTKYGENPYQIVIYTPFTPGAETGNTVSTVHYVVSDHKVPAPKDNVQVVNWTRTITSDKDGNLTYGNWSTDTSKYSDVATPELSGYTADILIVNGKNTKYGENPYQVVVYTPKDKQITPSSETGVTTSTVHYIISDGKVVAPKDNVQTVAWSRTITPDKDGKITYGDWSTNTNKYSDVVTPTLSGYTADILTVNGKNTKYGENPYQVVVYTPKDKQITPSLETGVTTSTVHYIISDGKVVAPKDNVQTVAWSRTITSDKDGNLTYGNWSTDTSKYSDVVTPELPGYTADILTVNGKNTKYGENPYQVVVYTPNEVIPVLDNSTPTPVNPTNPANPTQPTTPTVPDTPAEPTTTPIISTPTADNSLPAPVHSTSETPNEEVITHKEKTDPTSNKRQNKGRVARFTTVKKQATFMPVSNSVESKVVHSSSNPPMSQSKDDTLPQTGANNDGAAIAAGLTITAIGGTTLAADMLRKKKRKN